LKQALVYFITTSYSEGTVLLKLEENWFSSVVLVRTGTSVFVMANCLPASIVQFMVIIRFWWSWSLLRTWPLCQQWLSFARNWSMHVM
jgi:hypothetical protein